MSFDCLDCGETINGTNCAYMLSYNMGWKKKPRCLAMCKCGYPVRAKELRDNVFKDFLDEDKFSIVDAFIYCEKAGGGHVYYGTYKKCTSGNGYTAEAMNAPTFRRYEGSK